MALIICPHCGKKVSDTQETCIHCGGSLIAQDVVEQSELNNSGEVPTNETANMVNYFELSEIERQNIETEFYDTNVRYLKDAAWSIVISAIRVVSAIDFSGSLIAFIVLANISDGFTSVYNEKKFEIGLVFLVCQFVLGAIGLIAVIISNRILKKKKKYWLVDFKKWLKNEKNIKF